MMSKIGIKIDLSTFFDDERKMVFVMVDPNWENVECLQKRVEFLFDVDSVRFLNSDGLFLPPQESIEIIRFCSGLKAFVPKDSLEKRKKKHSKKSKCSKGESEIFKSEKNHCEENKEGNDSKKKRKYCSLDNGQSASPNTSLAKRLKNCVSAYENLSQTNKSTEITSTSEQIPTLLAQPSTLDVAIFSKPSKSKKSKVSTTNLNHEITDIGVEQNLKSSDELNTTCKEIKQLHTSTPKVTTVETESEEEKSFNDDLNSCVERVSSIPSSTFLNETKMMGQKNSSTSNNPFRKQSSGKGHIYFNETGEIVDTTTKKQSKDANNISKINKTVVVFRCPLQDVAVTPNPRIFQIKRHSTGNEKRKPLLEIRENLILPPIPNLSVEIKNLSMEGNATTELSNKEKCIETEKSPLNNTTNYIENSTIDKNNELTSDGSVKSAQSENNKEVSPSKQKATLKLQSDNINATSESNCVDLSIDLDEGDTSKASEKKFDTSSDVEEVSEIIDLNETEDNCNSTVNESISSPSLAGIRIDKILPHCSAVLDMPNINDVIVFKMASIDNNQRYGVTKYLAGRVEYINKRTKAIKMLIVDGLTELCHIPSNCITNLDNSQDNMRYLQIKMNDMIEPKVYYMP